MGPHLENLEDGGDCSSSGHLRVMRFHVLTNPLSAFPVHTLVRVHVLLWAGQSYVWCMTHARGHAISADVCRKDFPDYKASPAKRDEGWWWESNTSCVHVICLIWCMYNCTCVWQHISMPIFSTAGMLGVDGWFSKQYPSFSRTCVPSVLRCTILTIWHDVIWGDTVQYDMIWHDTKWYDTIRYDTTCRNVPRYDIPLNDMKRYDML